MKKHLKIRDLTLRDGQQSSFATRMTQEQIDSVLPYYKEANFYAMEVWGGAVPDSIMRYLGENPWARLEKIKSVIGDVSLLTALSRGRNLFGYAPYPDDIIEGFCRCSIESGLGVMRIFDALNDVNNVASTIKYIKKYGGVADCAICYTIDPKPTEVQGFFAKLFAKKPAPIFTDDYFVDKARQMKELGADMITIKDMSGLIPPKRVFNLIKRLKQELGLPVDFHTHCTPGYGLASVVSAIAAGVDIVDTAIWNFSGGTAAPSIEFIYLFCQRMDIELDINMESVAKINNKLFSIRKELEAFDTSKQFPTPFNPLTDKLPEEIETLIDTAIQAAYSVDEQVLITACQKIEAHYHFPAPNELVKEAEIPGGMYSNMIAQLKALKSEAIMPEAMKLIPQVRKAAGLVPLVTPTSQIVGAQAVTCALSLRNGKPMYSSCSNQFVALIKGEYGTTPIAIDPKFREQITGSAIESNYDTSKHKIQENPILSDCGGVPLASNEKELLLLELFPQVAKDYLTKVKYNLYEATIKSSEAESINNIKLEKKLKRTIITGTIISYPMPGRVLSINLKVGDIVNEGDTVLILEAMKMENSITTPIKGIVKQVFVKAGDTVLGDIHLMEIE